MMKVFFTILLSGVMHAADAQSNDSSLKMNNTFLDTAKWQFFIPSPRSAVSFSPSGRIMNVNPKTAAGRLSLYSDPRYKPTIALPITNSKEPWYTGAASFALQFLLPANRIPPPKN